MKRDMDLIRKILLKVEEYPQGWFNGELTIDGYSPEEIGYHCYLLCDAGYANGVDATSTESSSPEYMINYLTWQGHEFIDSVRNETVWKKVKEKIVTGVTTASMEIVKQCASYVVKQAIGI